MEESDDVRVYFMVGKPGDDKLKKSLKSESERHGDIVSGDFYEQDSDSESLKFEVWKNYDKT